MVPIKLPRYITLASPVYSLRVSHKDPLTFESKIKPRITKKVKRKYKKSTKSSIKVKVTKKVAKTTKRKKKKSSYFFKLYKHRTRENIYKLEKNCEDDFGEHKVLTNSFFYRTHLQWNNLPLENRIIENYEVFKTKLEEYLWESILGEEQDNIDLTLPGD